MITIKAPTCMKAWDKINQAFITMDPEIFSEGNFGKLTNSWFLYDLSIEIEDPIMDPEFDYAQMFHYTRHKWSNLISNYLNLDHLDQVKSHLMQLEKDLVKNRHYCVGFNFSDGHKNGKGCLLSGIFNHTLIEDKPQLQVFMRAAEVTTRLAVDLLFLQRIGEYIYGAGKFTLKIFIKQAMAQEHLLVIYNNRKSITKLLKKCEDKKHLAQLKNRIDEMTSAKEEDYIKYATHFRAYKILHPEKYPSPKPLLAKDCVIGDWDGVPLPEKCPSVMERDKIKKLFSKFSEKYGIDFSRLSTRTTAVKGNLLNLGDDEEGEVLKSKKVQEAEDDELPF